jgi:perosamine synthetase
VSNGTVALQLAVAALRLEPGTEIVMPAFTIISCALAAVYNRLVPRLVDVDPETWCLDVEQVARRIGPQTRAVMPVHMYGHPADMDTVVALAGEHRLSVIEDAAEAHGAEYRSHGSWRRCGSFGDVSCFSFYANKPVTTGEGGMVLTDDDEVARRLRSLRNLAFGRDERFVHDELGFNFRMTNLQAALGVAQVERVDAIVARKREIGRAYTDRLDDVEGLRLPAERLWARTVYWMYGIVLDPGRMATRDLAEGLAARGIETRPFFRGLHEQPALRRLGLFDDESYPVTESLGREGLYLPSGSSLTDAGVDEVCTAVRELLR